MSNFGPSDFPSDRLSFDGRPPSQASSYSEYDPQYDTKGNKSTTVLLHDLMEGDDDHGEEDSFSFHGINMAEQVSGKPHDHEEKEPCGTPSDVDHTDSPEDAEGSMEAFQESKLASPNTKQRGRVSAQVAAAKRKGKKHSKKAKKVGKKPSKQNRKSKHSAAKSIPEPQRLKAHRHPEGQEDEGTSEANQGADDAADATGDEQGEGDKKETSSQYRGVCKEKNRWRAQFSFMSKRLFLGGFQSELEAAQGIVPPSLHPLCSMIPLIPMPSLLRPFLLSSTPPVWVCCRRSF